MWRGRDYCDRSRVYSNVKEVEFNQGLLWCDYSNLVEGLYQCLKRRAVLEFFGCEDCMRLLDIIPTSQRSVLTTDNSEQLLDRENPLSVQIYVILGHCDTRKSCWKEQWSELTLQLNASKTKSSDLEDLKRTPRLSQYQRWSLSREFKVCAQTFSEETK